MSLEAGFGKRTTTYPLEKVIMGDEVPFPLNLLDTFAEQELSSENVEFYREAQRYTTSPELQLRDGIVDNYVRPGSDREINISSNARTEILERQKNEPEPKKDVFVNAQGEVFELIKRDTFPRFKRKIQETNLNFKTASQATMLGLKFLLFAVVLTVVTFALQITCDPSIVPPSPSTEFCTSIEILGNRFWRLLAAPFYMCAIMFILAGREKFCPICANAGTNFQYSAPSKSYFRIITSKVLPEYVVKVPEIMAANKQKARRSIAITVVSSMMIAVVMVLVPPDVPRWYS